MYDTVQSEAVFFLACTAAGAITAFLYDLVRISRRLVRISDWAVNGQDILFFALAAVILFHTAFTKNGGEVRLQGFFGGALGIFGYVFLVRNRFVNLGTTVAKWAIKSLLFVLKIVLFPIRILLRAVRKPVRIIAWYTGRALKRARRVAKCQAERAKIRISVADLKRRKK